MATDARGLGLSYLLGGAVLAGFAAFFGYHRDHPLAAVNLAGAIVVIGIAVRRLASKRQAE
jgi:hypothetical protein